MLEQWWLIFKYAFLGLLQGFTEPIPISSSGHLVIAEHFMGLHVEGLGFEILVNFASLLAVLLIYRKDLLSLAQGCWLAIVHRRAEHRADLRFVGYLIVGTIPAAILGILLGDVIADALKGVHIVGITLMLTGLALWAIRKMKGKRADQDLTLLDAIIVGLAQAIALVPGISRSGATVIAALGRNMNQATALRFSFFLYIPVSLGSMILEGPDLLSDPNLKALAFPYVCAFLFSLLASYYSLRWFMHIMEKGRLIGFSLYCLIAGAIVLVLA